MAHSPAHAAGLMVDLPESLDVDDWRVLKKELKLSGCTLKHVTTHAVRCVLIYSPEGDLEKVYAWKGSKLTTRSTSGPIPL